MAAAAAKSKTLAEALAAFQAELPTVDLDGYNPGFKNKFASLANITKKVIPVLTKHGFSYTVGSFVDNGVLIIQAHLLHESGESRDFQFPITETQPQRIGSAITYAKRYAIQALTGVVADEDDDGNAATQQPPKAIQEAEKRRANPPQGQRNLATQQKIVDDFITPGKVQKEQVTAVKDRISAETGKKGEELMKLVYAALEKGEVG